MALPLQMQINFYRKLDSELEAKYQGVLVFEFDDMETLHADVTTFINTLTLFVDSLVFDEDYPDRRLAYYDADGDFTDYYYVGHPLFFYMYDLERHIEEQYMPIDIIIQDANEDSPFDDLKTREKFIFTEIRDFVDDYRHLDGVEVSLLTFE